jgi:hypothetical protein
MRVVLIALGLVSLVACRPLTDQERYALRGVANDATQAGAQEQARIQAGQQAAGGKPASCVTSYIAQSAYTRCN